MENNNANICTDINANINIIGKKSVYTGSDKRCHHQSPFQSSDHGISRQKLQIHCRSSQMPCQSTKKEPTAAGIDTKNRYCAYPLSPPCCSQNSQEMRINRGRKKRFLYKKRDKKTEQSPVYPIYYNRNKTIQSPGGFVVLELSFNNTSSSSYTVNLLSFTI